MPPRQASQSALMPASRRPDMPPMALPLIYRPMPRPIDCGCIFSLSQVIATAGRPLRAKPSNARSSSDQGQSDTNVDSNTSTDEDNNDQVITRLRPQLSDNAPANSIDTASSAVVTDSESALTAALTP